MSRKISEIKKQGKLIADNIFYRLYEFENKDEASPVFEKAFENLDKIISSYQRDLEIEKMNDYDACKKYLANYYKKKFIIKK